MATTLKRTGIVQYQAMLVTRSPQPDWNTPTLLQTDLLNSAAIIAYSGRSCIKSMADDSQERSILA